MNWLRSGRQRAAVARVLRRPSTQLELLRLARETAPSLQLGDIWLILREAMDCGLVECLNPDQPTGKVFFYTALGRQAAERALGMAFEAVPDQMDWNCYARVIRAKVRRRVLVQIARNGPGLVNRNTALSIKRQISHPHAIAINTVIRALHQLVRERLMEALTSPEGRRVFAITDKGLRIAEHIDEINPGQKEQPRSIPNGLPDPFLNPVDYISA